MGPVGSNQVNIFVCVVKSWVDLKNVLSKKFIFFYITSVSRYKSYIIFINGWSLSPLENYDSI